MTLAARGCVQMCAIRPHHGLPMRMAMRNHALLDFVRAPPCRRGVLHYMAKAVR
jgi:hypothetical protein